MIGHESPVLRQAASNQGTLRAANIPAISSIHGTLILDRLGRILSCGTPAENIFGVSRARLMGRQVSEFIASLLVRGTSPSYHARHVEYLCADDEWRKFEATDATGNRFGIELTLSRMTIEGQEMFLLTVRIPEAIERQLLKGSDA